MKTRIFPLTAALGILVLSAGCGHLDVAPESSPNRVLNGTLTTGVALPAGAEIMVRMVARTGAEPVRPAGGDLPVASRPGQATERILGEHVQTLAAAAGEPVPFRIEYEADDAMVRRGLNLEARVFYGGRVRFRTVNAHVVTLSSAPYRQDLTVQAVDR